MTDIITTADGVTTSNTHQGSLAAVLCTSITPAAALQRQIHTDYNKTATALNATGGHVDDVIDHVTLTWDAMQTKVFLQLISDLSNSVLPPLLMIVYETISS